jgi:DNA-binding response OmpR family regulator
MPTDPVVDPQAPHVLLIDDDPNLGEIVSALLAAFGYDFQGAADGQSGLVRFDAGEWDLVLVDLATPEISGWEVIETIRQRASTVPIILLTRVSNAAVLRRARECNVVVIAKPFHLHTLKAALVEALYAQIG